MSILQTLLKIPTLTASYQQKERKELERTLTNEILIKRRNYLQLTHENDTELQLIIDKLDYFYYGIHR